MSRRMVLLLGALVVGLLVAWIASTGHVVAAIVCLGLALALIALVEV